MPSTADQAGQEPPDGHLGRTPWWTSATVKTWMGNRPGQGKGGGRPRLTDDQKDKR